MANEGITEGLQQLLTIFLKKHKEADLLTTYFFFLEKKYHIEPCVFIREKKIYKSKDEILDKVKREGKLWRETEIKIEVGPPTVNEQTKKIYICPFTGKAFGDNTHPNAQDAIYDWVAKCSKNTERSNGMRVKRFFVSEDPEVIKNYITQRKKAITKTVFSSGVTGKLFNSKEAVIEDFEKNQLRPIELINVPNQNRFQIEDGFLSFIQEHLDDTRISAFIEELSNLGDLFAPHVKRWTEEAK